MTNEVKKKMCGPCISSNFFHLCLWVHAKGDLAPITMFNTGGSEDPPWCEQKFCYESLQVLIIVFSLRRCFANEKYWMFSIRIGNLKKYLDMKQKAKYF